MMHSHLIPCCATKVQQVVCRDAASLYLECGSAWPFAVVMCGKEGCRWSMKEFLRRQAELENRQGWHKKQCQKSSVEDREGWREVRAPRGGGRGQNVG